MHACYVSCSVGLFHCTACPILSCLNSVNKWAYIWTKKTLCYNYSKGGAYFQYSSLDCCMSSVCWSAAWRWFRNIATSRDPTPGCHFQCKETAGVLLRTHLQDWNRWVGHVYTLYLEIWQGTAVEYHSSTLLAAWMYCRLWNTRNTKTQHGKNVRRLHSATADAPYTSYCYSVFFSL